MALLAKKIFRCVSLFLVVSSVFGNDTSEQDSTAVPLPGIQQAAPGIINVGWADTSLSWVLETSFDLHHWAHIDSDTYQQVSPSEFDYQQSGLDDRGFFRLRCVGQPNIYVVGDSISGWYRWPDDLELLTGRLTFSQAIGGAGSPSMVDNAKGVDLVYPRKGMDSIQPGRIAVKWDRHRADRTNESIYRYYWPFYSKTVSEPYSIEVYDQGRLIGFAQHVLKQVSTDYVSAPKTIFCEAHGLKDGDQVVFISQDPDYPSDLSVTDSFERWSFSSPGLPSAVVERRVYFAANVTLNSFEIRENPTSATTLNLGSNAQSDVIVELGWVYDWDYAGGEWDLTWEAFEIEQSGTTQMWVGPGYVPLQFRHSFSDGIHLSPAGDRLLATAIAEAISNKSW